MEQSTNNCILHFHIEKGIIWDYYQNIGLLLTKKPASVSLLVYGVGIIGIFNANEHACLCNVCRQGWTKLCVATSAKFAPVGFPEPTG